MKKIYMIAVILMLPMIVFAQTKVNAEDIINQINNGKEVSYQNVEVIGDLDFTTVDDVKRDRRRNSGSDEGVDGACRIHGSSVQ